MAKKLKVEDIPDGYNYAAVDADGFGWAYKDIPQLNKDDGYWCFALWNDALKLGNGYDSTDWQNSLVSRETAERPRFKNKLNWAHIPQDLNWAAVDKDGSAWAFKQKPTINKQDGTWFTYTPEYLFQIGEGFDSSDWQNSLLSRETAEQKPELKKLTAADIPEGYSYAAIDSAGGAHAYKDLPILFNQFYDSSYESKYKYLDHRTFLGVGYDKTNWQNSLVTRENIETQPAYKETTNKLSYSEIDPYFLEAMARRMNEGKRKYGPNNWKKLSDINELLDAAQRHLLELRKMMEEDFETIPGQETDLQHCAALACNAMFIHYHLNPNT